MAKSILIIVLSACIFGFAAHKTKPEKIVIEVPEKEREFSDYLKESARAYNVPETIAFAMVWQESRGRMDSIRYEPGQVERARKLTKASGENLRMYASSHCAGQVMGYHTPALGLSWSDLYNPQTCAEVSMKIMGQCMQRHKEKDPLTRTHQALKCYNGSDEYARNILNRLGQKLLEQHLRGGV
jgi:soluble lytic murein transglycosylase-like protein